MTEKRFYMDKSGDLYDKENGLLMLDFGYSYDGVNCKRLIDLLNELHEENQSKQKLIHLAANKIDNLLEENKHIKHTIKTMMENERTELGQSVLKQLWEQIE